MSIKTDEAGIGRWNLRDKGSALEVTFAYSDNTNTTVCPFPAQGSIPGTFATDAGTFTFSSGDESGDVTFEPSEPFVDVLRARGLRVYRREVLGCAIMRMPQAYLLDALSRLKNAEILAIIGMYMFGITEDDITETLAKIPDASPMDVTSDHMMKRHRPSA